MLCITIDCTVIQDPGRLPGSDCCEGLNIIYIITGPLILPWLLSWLGSLCISSRLVDFYQVVVYSIPHSQELEYIGICSYLLLA